MNPRRSPWGGKSMTCWLCHPPYEPNPHYEEWGTEERLLAVFHSFSKIRVDGSERTNPVRSGRNFKKSSATAKSKIRRERTKQTRYSQKKRKKQLICKTTHKVLNAAIRSRLNEISTKSLLWWFCAGRHPLFTWDCEKYGRKTTATITILCESDLFGNKYIRGQRDLRENLRKSATALSKYEEFTC